MPFTPTTAQLQTWVSEERLTRYRAAQSDTDAMYMWNAELNAALFELIGHGEIILRNVIHAQLAPHSPGGAWYDDTYYRFNASAQREIQKAKGRAARAGVVSPGRVVAELTFGFWRYMLTSSYQTTAWPRIKPGFTGVPRHERDRARIEAIVARIHDVRNRVAHHEPVFHTNVAQHFADIADLARHVDADASQWMWQISRVSDIMTRRPA